MIEGGVVVLRWVQFLSATAALGLPLFILYASAAVGDGAGSIRQIVPVSTLVLALAAGAGLLLQTAMMAGSTAAAIDPTAVAYVAQSTELGRAHVARAGLALAAGIVLIAGRGGVVARWIAVALLMGAVASFAWSGHGASTGAGAGALHLAADIVHAWGAALWLGALIAFGLLLRRSSGADPRALARALGGFASIGTGAVVILTVTGIINAVFLIGPSNLAALGTSAYGLLLSAKVAVFLAMLAMAARNRFVLTPALTRAVSAGGDAGAALSRLRSSVLWELGAGVGLLGLVAALGVQMPPVAM